MGVYAKSLAYFETNNFINNIKLKLILASDGLNGKLALFIHSESMKFLKAKQWQWCKCHGFSLSVFLKPDGCFGQRLRMYVCAPNYQYKLMHEKISFAKYSRQNQFIILILLWIFWLFLRMLSQFRS